MRRWRQRQAPQRPPPGLPTARRRRRPPTLLLCQRARRPPSSTPATSAAATSRTAPSSVLLRRGDATAELERPASNTAASPRLVGGGGGEAQQQARQPPSGSSGRRRWRQVRERSPWPSCDVAAAMVARRPSNVARPPPGLSAFGGGCESPWLVRLHERKFKREAAHQSFRGVAQAVCRGTQCKPCLVILFNKCYKYP